MPQPDRAWWDDVQYLREPLERKREKEARRGLRLDARAAARAVAERHATAPVADAEPDYIHGLDSIHELDAVPRARRFERTAPEADGAPRRRRFERSERSRGTRDPRRMPTPPPSRARAASSAPPRRRGRFARGERDTREHVPSLDRAPEAPAAAAPTPLSAPPRRAHGRDHGAHGRRSFAAAAGPDRPPAARPAGRPSASAPGPIGSHCGPSSWASSSSSSR
jgi:hypothetical protein